MSSPLFERCEMCTGTRKLTREVKTGRRLVAVEPLCNLCHGSLSASVSVHRDGAVHVERAPCPSCCGPDGKPRVRLPKESDEVLPIGAACQFCSTGYHEIGITAKQLESIIEERDKLLEFVARVSVTEPADVYGSVFGLKTEAAELVKGKGARVEEYRHRKGIKGAPPVPFTPQAATGIPPE